MRKKGRHVRDRLRAMRFALYAQHISPELLTVKQVAGLLDLNKSAAAKWRRDYLEAISPIDIDGVPPFLGVDPRQLPFASAAAPVTRITQGDPT